MKRLMFFYSLLLAAGPQLTAQLNRIEFTAPAVYPEGIVYDRSGDVFYVSSVSTGAIGKVDRKGKYSVVLGDSSLKSTYGMKLSRSGDRLWVCAGDANYSKYRHPSTHKKMIRLIGIETSTGKKIADVDLSTLYEGEHFANDLTLDDKGNIYITDSYSPVIYMVENGSKASVLAKSNLFKSAGVGLNGIVWHPSGFLLVVNNGSGCVFKLNPASTDQVSKVKIDQFFPGADGLLLDDNNNLLLVQNKGTNKVFRLTSNDNWASAKLTAYTRAEERLEYPSTITSDGRQVWVMNSKLNELADSSHIPSTKFNLQQVTLTAVNK